MCRYRYVKSDMVVSIVRNRHSDKHACGEVCRFCGSTRDGCVTKLLIKTYVLYFFQYCLAKNYVTTGSCGHRGLRHVVSRQMSFVVHHHGDRSARVVGAV